MAREETYTAIPQGLRPVTPSLGGAPTPFFLSRMKTIAPMETEVRVYGDEATVAFMDSLNLPIGTHTPITWDSLEYGWLWEFYVHKGKLEVTEPDGTAYSRDIDRWSDLAVSWEVLESHQFVYIVAAHQASSPYIIASRYAHTLQGWLEWISWAEYDFGDGTWEYLPFANMIVVAKKDGGGISHILSFEGASQSVMVSLGQMLEAEGVYPISISEGNEGLTAEYEARIAGCVKMKWHDIMFWSMATASLFRGSGRPTYEPWMLWEMWKWLAQKTPSELGDIIFDLSPNWGDTSG